MKPRTSLVIGLALLVLAVSYFTYQKKEIHRERNISSSEGSQIVVSQNDEKGETKNPQISPRPNRNGLDREKKSPQFYYWKATNIQPDEAASVIDNAFSDLGESEFERFISGFWGNNIDVISPSSAINVCEAFDGDPAIKRCLYLSMFGALSTKSEIKDLERTQKIVNMIPVESGFRHLGFRSYYNALSRRLVSIEDFTPLVESIKSLHFTDDKEGARSAIAGAIEAKIQKDSSFIEAVRGWNVEDDVKRQVLVFHPLDGVLK